MSSTLRLSIIMVLLLATAALGLIAYNMNLPQTGSTGHGEQAPAPLTAGYFVAARPLPAGTLARDEDFYARCRWIVFHQGRSVIRPTIGSDFAVLWFASSSTLAVPSHHKTYCARRDRGFLASVLAPGTRAISIKVDAESGVSGLIWPGDYVDVVLTQVAEKGRSSRDRALSETVLHNVRIIAIDQEIVQGGPTTQ